MPSEATGAVAVSKVAEVMPDARGLAFVVANVAVPALFGTGFLMAVGK